MWMDIAVALIFVFSTSSGFHNGFVRTFMHTAGWLLSLLLGFFSYGYIDLLLRNNTGYYAMIHEMMIGKIAEEGSIGSFSTNMPAILYDILEPIKNSVTSAIAAGITDFLFKIICFLLTVAVLRMIFFVIVIIFSKKRNKGLFGFADGILGLLLGIVKGFLLIFLLLALLVPVLNLYTGGLFINALESSNIASVLYDNNYLLLVFKNAF